MKVITQVSVVVMAAVSLTAQEAGPVPSPATLGLMVYAAKGQDATQQQKDEGECYGWAKQQTGIDPSATPAPAAPPETAGPSGAGVKGAARGAAKGAVVGEVANDDASDGAAIGAAAGAVKGRRAAKKQAQAQQQQAQQKAQAQVADTKATFNKAMGACLEGRGYSVK